MDQNPLTAVIKDQTWRALWEVKNVIDCVPDELWDKTYCAMPCWKHIYHMLHSLDLWLINPRDRMYPVSYTHLDVYKRQVSYCWTDTRALHRCSTGLWSFSSFMPGMCCVP